MSSDVASRLARVRERVISAASRAGRSPEQITVIAVSKRHPAVSIRAALDAGQIDFGENYAQELLDKQSEVEEPSARWHFIGRLQRNKVRHLLGRVALIHGVDSIPLIGEIDKRAKEPQEILLQVALAGEAHKGGISPDSIEPILGASRHSKFVRCVGLMTMPPLSEESEESRSYYRQLSDLGAKLGLRHLSMGMSSDYEVAIEEGATMVRVGTAIFGEREG